MGKKFKSYIYVPFLAGSLFLVGMYLNDEKFLPESNKQNQVYHLDEYFNKQETINLEKRVVDEQGILLEQQTNEISNSSAEFLLKLENDFVVVYRTSDLAECYMVTGISINDLPPITIEELKTGKEISNEEALYFFLESHSS